jgi:branched-chain amino acid transport system ATP-binding protein
MTRLLDVKDIDTAYGTSQVLFGMTLHVDEGEIGSLLGRNGMGKTTTVRSIMGINAPARGAISFHGRDLRGKAPDEVARIGVGLVPEGRQIFPNLTAEENLIAFAARRNGSTTPWTLERVYGLFPRLRERRRNMGNQLSGGEQQMLAIARALVTNAHLLIIDEATEGLAPLIREDIWKCLRLLKEQGQAVLVIDKYVERLIPVCSRHYVIEAGRVVWSGSSARLKSDHSVWQRYLGI